MIKLNNKRVLITGGAMGIGKETVYRDLMKGIFTFPLFIKVTRWLKVQQSMDTHRGYTT